MVVKRRKKVCNGILKNVTKENTWKRVLYLKQPFPDNYSGHQFINSLRKNGIPFKLNENFLILVNLKKVTFTEAVLGSCYVMHHISSVILFGIIFTYSYMGMISWESVFSVTLVTFFIGYILYLKLLNDTDNLKLSAYNFISLKTIILYAGYAYGFSPVCQTLTATVSTDSTVTTSAFMFLVNIIFCNYGCDVAMVSSALSMNAGIFGTVCLVSRLSNRNEVFTLLTFSVVIFVVWPLLRGKLLEIYPTTNVPLAMCLAICVTASMYPLSSVMTLLYVALHIFITFMCSALFVVMQSMKRTLHGAWEEASLN
ncbi:Phosphatidylinositol N-acetylglucosaminyltransferase subunit C [Trichinella pseudospiralis]|uniref:Phosphatidylinositol N-acetylglucosaminyltransferase subunit C n=1 Tax=Trichinella pseudospiralis TaxID=6337 RepID=A0A0V1FM04_TRIPS|nr:Phosphatidylinositol N-acetylglucosaminyltransferase subunit C [Trichinella pseudospiralis]